MPNAAVAQQIPRISIAPTPTTHPPPPHQRYANHTNNVQHRHNTPNNNAPTATPNNNYAAKPTPTPNFKHRSLLKFEPSEGNHYYDESELENDLKHAVEDLGVKRLVRGKSDRNDKVKCSKGLTDKVDRAQCMCSQCALYRKFPCKRRTILCGSCSKQEREKPHHQRGCYGLLLHAKIVTDSISEPIHLVIDKFTLPETSKHALVSSEVWEKHRGTVKHENELTSQQTATIEALGAARVPSYQMKRTLKFIFPKLVVDDSLMWRLVGKGRREAFGDDNGDMALFIEKGLKWKEAGGRFEVHTSGNTLHSWSGQMADEVILAKQYGGDLVFIDTTFNTCKHILKTGPLATVDCFFRSAPCGILQIEQEVGELVDERLQHLGFNESRTVARTDAGTGWPFAVVEKRGMVHTEDPKHIHDGAMEMKGKCGMKSDPATFVDEAGRALYGFPMNNDGLNGHLEMMKEKYTGTGVANWVNNVSAKKVKRCFSFTCNNFRGSTKFLDRYLWVSL